jgi:hypothetical protein
MITWTAITDAPTQLDFETTYLLRFLNSNSEAVYILGKYKSTNASGDHYTYSLPTNVEPLANATHFATINEPV